LVGVYGIKSNPKTQKKEKSFLKGILKLKKIFQESNQLMKSLKKSKQISKRESFLEKN
jgi:hypothetical protein